MTYAPDKPKEQHFFYSGVTWERFKSLQAGFADSPGIRLFYYRGEVEIVSISPEHEIISGIIAILLAIYFEEKGIEFTPTGSFTQERKQEASAQADQSYFISDLGTTPDRQVSIGDRNGMMRRESSNLKPTLNRVFQHFHFQHFYFQHF